MSATSDQVLAQADEQDRASESGGSLAGVDVGVGGGGRVTSGNPNDVGGGGLKKLDKPVGESDQDFDRRNIYQGGIGDCWLVSALGGVSQQDPQFMREHIVANPDGSYTVTMYDKKGGFWPWDPERFEAVEVRVPGEVFADGAHGPTGDPNWVSIYERAAAIHRGGTAEDINGGYVGEGLEMVTGRPAETRNDPSLASIQEGLKEGRIYEAASESDDTWWPFDDEVDNPHVVANHAYMVDKVEMHDGEMKIHVLNPWGPAGQGDKYGDLWLTEDEFHQNFGDVASVSGK